MRWAWPRLGGARAGPRACPPSGGAQFAAVSCRSVGLTTRRQLLIPARPQRSARSAETQLRALPVRFPARSGFRSRFVCGTVARQTFRKSYSFPSTTSHHRTHARQIPAIVAPIACVGLAGTKGFSGGIKNQMRCEKRFPQMMLNDRFKRASVPRGLYGL
ncbi:unnamed protein product, partial [Iphiclides podalirius]